MSDEAIDAVYTWVDDRWPGYVELLRRYATAGADLNPNRTRDNLGIVKYSLRSLARHVPWIRNVYVVTCAPQAPPWLDREAVRLIHHDAILEPEVLPTFNSFAILSALHRLPGLSRRFLYIEDDMLFGRPVRPADFADDAGRLRLFPRLGFTAPAGARQRSDLSPWNASLATANDLLDRAFGSRQRHGINHVPLLIDRDRWQEMEQRWPEAFARTRASRFRGQDNIPPEYLYPYFLLHTGRAVSGGLRQTYRDTVYVPLENLPLTTWLALARARRMRPKIVTLNDGFGENPRQRVVEMARAFLEESFPLKSRFEL